jgi:hypothetical protein
VATPPAMSSEPRHPAMDFEDVANRPALHGLLLNHIFLPPRLPQEADLEERAISTLLIDKLVECANEFQTKLPQDMRWQWPSIVRMLERLGRTIKISLSPQGLSEMFS